MEEPHNSVPEIKELATHLRVSKSTFYKLERTESHHKRWGTTRVSRKVLSRAG